MIEVTPKLLNTLRVEGEKSLENGDKENGEALIESARRLGFDYLEEKIREDPELLYLIGYSATLNPVLRPLFQELQQRLKDFINEKNATND